jgi:cyclophilin family peptidyl-prolyl cis-trans isomerase
MGALLAMIAWLVSMPLVAEVGPTPQDPATPPSTATQQGTQQQQQQTGAQPPAGAAVVPGSTVVPGEAARAAADRPQFAKYLAIKEEILPIESRIATMLKNVDFVKSAERRSVLQSIDQLREKKKALIKQIHEQSVEAYLEAPDEQLEVIPVVAEYINGLLCFTVSDYSFQPAKALEVAQRLGASSGKDPRILYVAALAAATNCQYDFALSLVAKIEKQDNPAVVTLTQEMEKSRDKWVKELAARKKDATTPLPRVTIKTEIGDFVVELFEDEAPLAVNQFVKLVQKKFYDGLPFYLVNPGQVAISGCKLGDGTTVDEYLIPDENKNENARSHFTGAISMYHTKPNGGSCQFLISLRPAIPLDEQLTVFGRIVEGLENLEKFERFDRNAKLAGRKPIKIISTSVSGLRDHPYDPAQKIPLDGK